MSNQTEDSDMVTQHFQLKQFACPCGCGRARVSPKLIEKLDAARARYGGPMKITSGYRCPEHNAKVGGKPDSAHTTGEAADIAFGSGASMFSALVALMGVGIRRIGVGTHFIHVDISTTLPTPAVWGYGTGK